MSDARTSEGSEHVGDDYPVRFSVDYPVRALNRLTTAFRVFTIIPIALAIASIGGYTGNGDFGAGSGTTIAVGGTGLLFMPLLLMIVFRQKYPRWWFDPRTTSSSSCSTSACSSR